MANDSATNIVWHPTTVTKEQRQKRAGHRSAVLWFTGLSGAGKSTLANAVEHELNQRGLASYVLDGDNIRHGLNKGLGFGEEDRKENIRRIGEVYVQCPLEECERRDVKGLYEKARRGEIGQFTGISAPYEEPDQPELVVASSEQSIEESVAAVLAYLEQAGILTYEKKHDA